METEVQNTVQENHAEFLKVYKEIVAECVKRRKSAGLTQENLAEEFKVDRRKISEFEKGEGGVGLMLRIADLLDIEVNLSYTAW